QPGDAGLAAENLDLAHRVLAGGGVESEQYRVRRRLVLLPEDADDLLQLGHQLGAVLEAPGGVDDQHLNAGGLRLPERVEGEAGGVGPDVAGDDLRAGALAPDLQLIDRRGAKGVAGGEEDAPSLGAELRGELADGGGLA